MNFIFLNRFDDNDETIPVVVNLDNLDYFRPWYGRNEGTYVAVGNGDALVVKESFDEIVKMLGRSV